MRTRSKGGTPRIPGTFDRMRCRMRRRAARHGAGGRALRQAARLPPPPRRLPRLLRRRRHAGRLLGVGSLGAGQPARAAVHERVQATHRLLDHGVHLAGAPYVGRVGRKPGDVLCDHGQAAPCPQRDGGVGRVPFVRRPAGLPPAAADALVPVLRQHMLSDCMIVPGLYRVGPNSGASGNLRPRALRRCRRTPPFLVAASCSTRKSRPFCGTGAARQRSRRRPSPGPPRSRAGPRSGGSAVRACAPLPSIPETRCGRKTHSCRLPSLRTRRRRLKPCVPPALALLARPEPFFVKYEAGWRIT